MRILTPNEMAKVEKTTVTKFGVPEGILMENAAIRAFDILVKQFDSINGKTFIIVAGKGNNAGDSFALARHIYNNGGIVKTYILYEEDQFTEESKKNFEILKKLNIPIEYISEKIQMGFQYELMFADGVIDGIFGTGLKREVEGREAEVIAKMNQNSKLIFALDIPSGICGTTGRVCGIAVKADITVTFGFLKTGLMQFPGNQYAGKIITVDISIPKEVVDSIKSKVFLQNHQTIKSIMHKRKIDGHKGDFGKVAIITGSKGMTGAGLLSAEAALRAGAGLVYLIVPERLVPVYESNFREGITIGVKDDDTGKWTREGLGSATEHLEDMDAILIGPGMNIDIQTEDLEALLTSIKVPIIIDAGALTILKDNPKILNEMKHPVIITPHAGEFMSMFGISREEIEQNRIQIAIEQANKANIIIVLKGALTVMAFPDAETFISPFINSGMATAGSGDVLGGLMAGLIASTNDFEASVQLGVYFHGMAGEEAKKALGETGMIAGDILKNIPIVMNS